MMPVEMRRQDRKLTDEETLQIIRQGEFGILSTVTPDRMPYAVPLSYAFDAEQCCLYFHGTNQDGQKIKNLLAQPDACFTIVSHTELMPERFATKYWSANVFGTVLNVNEDAEKRKGLALILKKYSPEHLEQGEKYIDGAIHRVRVMKMKIESMTGKARKK